MLFTFLRSNHTVPVSPTRSRDQKENESEVKVSMKFTGPSGQKYPSED